MITVVADGSWCKRSYKTKYDSLSGVVRNYKFYQFYIAKLYNNYILYC